MPESRSVVVSIFLVFDAEDQERLDQIGERIKALAERIERDYDGAEVLSVTSTKL